MHTEDTSQDSRSPSDEESFWSRFNFRDYLFDELTRGLNPQQDEASFLKHKRSLATFYEVPLRMEAFFLRGILQMLDLLLHVYTLLPLRCVLAFTVRPVISSAVQRSDLLKGCLMLICSFLMTQVDTSMLYHMLRGQNVIKLYILYNILEVADRLLSSIGQDMLEVLYWSVSDPRRCHSRRRLLGPLVGYGLPALISIFLHCCLMLLQTTTLSVAFNSHSATLLTIMMSNNFVELKGSVFKKFTESNLYQMSCADLRERFNFVVFFSLILARNAHASGGWNMGFMAEPLLHSCYILLVEVLIDWVKHCFITKFNNISADVYLNYQARLAYDVCNSRSGHHGADHFDLISRRMGFTPLPLACLINQALLQIFWPTSWLAWLSSFAIGCLLFGLLLMAKLAVNLTLIWWAECFLVEYEYQKKERERSEESEENFVEMQAAQRQRRGKSAPPFHRRTRSDSGWSINVTNSEPPIRKSAVQDLATEPVLLTSSTRLERTKSLDESRLELLHTIEIEKNEALFECQLLASSADPENSLLVTPQLRRRTRTSSRHLQEGQQPLQDVDRYSMVSGSIV